jgi:hypothetical protein
MNTPPVNGDSCACNAELDTDIYVTLTTNNLKTFALFRPILLILDNKIQKLGRVFYHSEYRSIELLHDIAQHGLQKAKNPSETGFSYRNIKSDYNR